MQPYLNLSGRSGVSHYEIGYDSIIVQFSDGAQYLYDHRSTGKYNIDWMKTLAANGVGLNSFISTTVRNLYSKKLRGKMAW
jgi:hypothetical protein